MYYYSFLGHLWDTLMSHKLRDFFGTLLGLIRCIYRAKKPQMNADERRFVTLTYRKGREERKSQLHKSLYLEEIIRPGTRMTRIPRIRTDTIIREHPFDLCSILFKDSDTINNELVRTGTNSVYSNFGG